MRRQTLKRYLQSLVLSTLAGCCSTRGLTEHAQIDDAGLALVDGGVPDSGELPAALCREICPKAEKLLSCTLVPNSGGEVACDEEVERCGFLPGGTPPAGLRPHAPIDGDDPVGLHFAEMAHVERAAVLGFLRLAEELRALGAPARLCFAAERAARDEHHHARIAERLARGYGATAPSVEIDPTPRRDAFALALANAADGSVYETFGAVVTEWQSRAARDRRVRAAFHRIAEDELRHAELASELARWLAPQLSPKERTQVRQARRKAAARLARELARPLPVRLVEVAGLPPPEASRQLIAHMTGRLWS